MCSTLSKSRARAPGWPRPVHQRERSSSNSRGTPTRRRSAAPARRAAHRGTIASSTPDRTERRSAAHSTRSSREPERRGPWRAGHGVARPADALQQRRDPVRRSDLADEIHVADVDAELERRGRDERLQLPGLQPRLGVEPLLLRQAAVMRGHRAVAEPFAQVPCQPLRQPARVHEHQRRPMAAMSDVSRS